MGELHYAQTSGATPIFFYAQTFIGKRTNGEESFDSHPPFGLTRTGTASSQSPTPLLTTSPKVDEGVDIKKNVLEHLFLDIFL